jgi:hypothetical protein
VVAKFGVTDDAADAVGVGLFVTDDVDLILSHTPLGSPGRPENDYLLEVSTSAIKSFIQGGTP